MYKYYRKQAVPPLQMDVVALYCAFLLFLINVLFTAYIQQADLLLVSVLVGHIVANTEPC